MCIIIANSYKIEATIFHRSINDIYIGTLSHFTWHIIWQNFLFIIIIFQSILQNWSITQFFDFNPDNKFVALSFTLLLSFFYTFLVSFSWNKHQRMYFIGKKTHVNRSKIAKEQNYEWKKNTVTTLELTTMMLMTIMRMMTMIAFYLSILTFLFPSFYDYWENHWMLSPLFWCAIDLFQ